MNEKISGQKHPRYVTAALQDGDPVSHAQGLSLSRIASDEASFRAMHDQNRMAKEKLAQGIEDFSKAIVSVEGLLKARLQPAAQT